MRMGTVRFTAITRANAASVRVSAASKESIIPATLARVSIFSLFGVSFVILQRGNPLMNESVHQSCENM
jgi:hypothetical protein